MIGREAELRTLAEFLEEIPAQPGALLLEGEAGIGKTTLWRHALELAAARSYHVLSCSPTGSETELAFAGLGDLLGDVVDEVLPLLPSPQRHALAVALLLDDPDGPPPEQRAVALAVLGAVRALSRDRPLVLAVDDVQWLDRSSAAVLDFALRRLRDERFVALFGRRLGDGADERGLSPAFAEHRRVHLTLGPLSLGAVHRLLGDRLGLVLPRHKLRRLHEVSDGNPFFALELGRAFERGVIRLQAGEPLPGSLTMLVADRLAALPPATGSVLLAVAALSQPTPELVEGAVDGESQQPLRAALDANVLELDGGRLRFSHPLLASAVYGAASAAEKRALHRRLAALGADAEERARHLALAADGPDRGISALLEDAAGRAHRRRAFPAAVELSEEARRLTPAEDADDRHRRTITAGTYAFAAGAGVRARELFEEALAAAPAGSRRAEALAWLGTLEEYDGSVRVAVQRYREGLVEARDDLELRAQLEDWLGDALFLMRTDLDGALEHARSAVAIAARIGDRYRSVPALSGEALLAAATGRPEWKAALEQATEIVRAGQSVELIVTPEFHRALILMWLDEVDEACSLLRSLCQQAEERGEEGALPLQLLNLSLAEQLAGRWTEAVRHAGEAIDVAEQIGQQSALIRALGARALVEASLGNAEEARRDAEATLSVSRESGAMLATMAAVSALGLLELSLGDPAAAHRALGPVVDQVEAGGVREPGSVRFVFDDVEALVGLGLAAEAEALLGRWEARAHELDRASALAAAARCRGLLAAASGDLEAALAFGERSLVLHDRVSLPFERARTLLVLGSTRRRARQRRAAREALEEANAIFEELGARLWADRAREELARIGGRAPSAAELTPSERRIATLVAAGKTNKEVAAALVLAERTVESALTQIYRKLDVRSRTELARKLSTVG